MSATKVCVRCRTEKDIEQFAVKRREKDGHDTRCKECINAYQRSEYQRNKRDGTIPNRETHRNQHLKRYGMTSAQYDALYAQQNGLCAICGKKETLTTRGVLRLLCVDHDHITGEVRGLLCSRCNVGLGAFGDTKESIEKVLRYLA
jgi:2-oxoglutarate dehydrogenase complex dehydrogenase (E1) component-like enzyme